MSETTIHSINLRESTDISDFLWHHGRDDDFKWFSGYLSKVNAIHRKKKTKKKLSAADRIQLKEAYTRFVLKLQDSDPVLFQERVSPREIQAWLNHSEEVLRQISVDPQWIKTGNMRQYELCLLNALSILMANAVPVAMAFEMDFFETLVSMVSTRRGTSDNAPSSGIADSITMLVMHVVRSCVFRFERKWKPEKVFKKLEATGLLEQFLFCSVLSRGWGGQLADVAMTLTFDQLLRCPAFVGKKFKEGTPCGDTARAILASDCGRTTLRPVAANYLEALVKFSWTLQPHNNIQACFCCNSSSPSSEFQNKLMQCSRCRAAYYCSKECQTAHWKNHKKTCKCLSKQFSKSERKNIAASHELVNGYTRTNYVHIMKAFAMECDKSGVQKKDMVIEVSFAPDSNGKVPALQDPPEFSIVPLKRYLDGSRQLEPDGIFKNRSQADREDFESSVRLVHNHSSPLDSTGVKYVFRTVDNKFTHVVIGLGQSQICSQEAVDAFCLAMNKSDFGPIANICRGDDKIMDLLRVQMGMPGDESSLPNDV